MLVNLLLNALLIAPLIGALSIILIPRGRICTVERTALGWSLAALFISVGLWVAYAASASARLGLEAGFSVAWIPALHIHYALSLDGFSMPLVGLTAILSSACILYSVGRIQERASHYYFFMLLLESFLLGVFCARDLFLFYVLFDASLVPMYFLIALWGGPGRARAALKFLLYTLAGSAALLIGLLWVYFRSYSESPGHIPTLDITELARLHLFAGHGAEQTVAFLLFAVAFAVKIPIVPVHTWLPEAYTEAPSAVTAMLAGAMGKMGIYGFLRLALPLFPEGARSCAPLLMALGVISIIYGALVALGQWDIKRLIAYSSVSHMGFVALGLAAVSAALPPAAAVAGSSVLPAPGDVALTGVVFEMFGHGLITGGLFLLAGMLAEQAGVRDLRTLTGAMRRAPGFVAILSLFMFASMAMPGLIGFWGELYVLLGAFQVFHIGTALAAIGIVITAGFFVWMLQRMAFGKASPATDRLADIRSIEIASIAPLAALMVLFGLVPALYLSPWTPTIHALVTQLAVR
jgi:NADH-quinone oxidoreductase subunit M